MQYVGYVMLAIPFIMVTALIIYCLGGIAYEEFKKNSKENLISIGIAVGLFSWLFVAAKLIELGKG